MGAGILPTTIYKNKLYFLFGKENKYEDSATGFSDFGGGTDNNESFMETALREASEELTGFLGSKNDIKDLLKNGTYNIDYSSNGHNTYRMHIFPMIYNPFLELYYNNNQKFLQKNLSKEIITSTKIFEKAEIRWVCVDDIVKMRSQFRHYFRNIVDMIYEERNEIKKFINKNLKKSNKKTRKNKTCKNKTYNRKTRKNL